MSNNFFQNLVEIAKHTRFRQEDGYILLCNVRTLQYFDIANKFLNILKQLEANVSSLKKDPGITEEELSLFIEDLREMKVLEND